jgi:hypothetical protein
MMVPYRARAALPLLLVAAMALGARAAADQNCSVSAWGNWSACNATASHCAGSMNETRTVLTPANGTGTPCPALVNYTACAAPAGARARVRSCARAWVRDIAGAAGATRCVVCGGGGGACARIALLVAAAARMQCD